MANDYEATLAVAERVLTDAQRDALVNGEDRLVTACPGAGKTRAVGARAALLAAQGRRVALTSYTNVGAREMREALERYFAVRLGDEHFVGTLHGYLLRFIFRPFGHTVMHCDREPGLRTSPSEEVVSVDGFQFNLDDFHFRPSGGLYFKGDRPSSCRIRNDDITLLGQDEARRLKVKEAAAGVVSAEDALFWSLQVLRSEGELCRAVAERFDEIIVDEAQDTSAIQLECLRAIRAEGLRSLVLVGDFDQSIYSFHGASPDACRRLASECGLVSVRLAENHRSSQLICNVAATLRPGGEPDAAVGPDRDFPVPPTYFLYHPADLASIPTEFAQRVGQHGAILTESAVVARTQGLVRALSGGGTRLKFSARSPVWGLLRAVGDRDGGLELAEVEGVERLLRDVVGNREEVVDAVEALRLRAAAMRTIEGLPVGEGVLDAWLNAAAAVVGDGARELGASDPAALVSNLLRIPQRFHGENVRDLVPAGRADGVRIATVHGVKGMSLDAALLVASPIEDWRGFEADSWARIWQAVREGGTISAADAEEARVLYVAVTRARRFCEVALPSSTGADVLEAFEAAGLQRA
ncbi:ATP-dependent helicase [Cellulomonas sp.]|uniref:UvrD-helicase domain-containing protein n=1 Tax=Cellulomonas sp. TaxID=40001 RepID=UPI00258ECB1E|nr:ATP-dependent helicase [Cellulomonas sp.]MCR6688107.1 ATP-dependent helicase [Cellulomonas sp.]